MKQPRTTIDNASEHTLNDDWNEERDCTRSLKDGLERQDSNCCQEQDGNPHHSLMDLSPKNTCPNSTTVWYTNPSLSKKR